MRQSDDGGCVRSVNGRGESVFRLDIEHAWWLTMIPEESKPFIPIDFILYRGKDNELRFLEFEGAYDPEHGHIYNRDGSIPQLPIREPVVVAGNRGRCPCCQQCLTATPGTDVLYPDGKVRHVSHFLPRCDNCEMVGQVTSCRKHGNG